MAKSAAKFVLILAAILATSIAPAAQRTFDKRFDAPAGGRLTFDADVGSVAVTGGDVPQVVVHADAQGSQSFLDRIHISAEQTASGVTISVRMDHTGWLDWLVLGSNRVDFTVQVPRTYPVDLRTSGGSLDVRNLNAWVRGKTSGGGIHVQDVAGEVNMHTSGGGVSAERVSGSANLSTSGGSIDAIDSTGDLDLSTSGGGIRVQNDDGKVNAHTSGGSIRAELRANHGITLDTSGGSITLLLPQSAHASIDAETSGGDVTSNLPVTTTGTVSGDHLHGTIGGGGPAVYLRTSGGSIRIGPES
jgi:Putative adhesin